MVSFGDNKKGKIIGIGSIGISPNPSIENVLLVDGLKHSISQLCDKGNRVIFDHKAIFIGNRHDNVYVKQPQVLKIILF